MGHITAEAKEQIVKKALGQGVKSLKEIATLGRWLRAYRTPSTSLGNPTRQNIKDISRAEVRSFAFHSLA